MAHRKQGKRAKVVGGMIKKFQSGVDSMTAKYQNLLAGKKTNKYKR